MYVSPFRCGHCKHFEPIYEDFAREVQQSADTVAEFQNLQVVRLDATVYSDVANHYDIRGYPTIKFIHQSKILTYESQRTKPALIKFIKRANGPPMKTISSKDHFDELRRESPVFFVFILDENQSLNDEFKSVVDRFYTQVDFYRYNDRTPFGDDVSQVFVIKNEQIYGYEPYDYHDKFEEFIEKENLPIFSQLSHSNIRDLIQTKKILVVYAYDEQKSDEQRLMKKIVLMKIVQRFFFFRIQVKDQVRQYAIENDSRFHQKFQFAWSTDLDLLSHIGECFCLMMNI